MKKIYKLLAITLVLVLPIISCTTDDVSAKQAQTDRDNLEIPGDDNNSPIQHNQLALYVSATNVPIGTLVTFTTMLNGVDVTDEVSYFINDFSIPGSSIASTTNGTFQVQAKLEGYIDSPIVTVVYGNGTNPNPNPTGNFTFNGQGYNMVANILVLTGNYLNSDEVTARSEWTSVVVNNTNLENATVGASIEFTTPFIITDLENGLGNLVYPNGTNETYVGASYILVDNQDFEDVVGNGNIHYTSNFNIDGTTNTFTSTISFNGNTLQINYNGSFAFIDNSEEASAKGIKQQAKLSKSSKKNKNTFSNLKK